MNFLRTIKFNDKVLIGLNSCPQKVLINNGFDKLWSGLPSIGINSIQKRQMAARRGKRIAASREKQRLARIRKEEEKNAAPKVWLPDRLRIDKSYDSYNYVFIQLIPDLMDRTLNVGPRRFSDTHLKDLDTICDDVFPTDLYKQITYSVIEAIDMQRETHDSTLLNEPNALVDAKVELDLRTKKKTKFCDAFKSIISYPNKFEFKANRRIIAICKKEEDKYDAKEAGADVVGGAEIIKMLQKGDLSMSNFDDLVCHGDLLVELAQIRGLLQHSFPSKLRGNLGFDIKKLVTLFVNGIDYKCIKDDFELDYGWVRVPFGRLDMSDEELQQNFRFLLSTIEKHKPPTAIGPFITRTLVLSDPSKEEFAVKFWDYIDGYEDPNRKDSEEEETTEKKSKLTSA